MAVDSRSDWRLSLYWTVALAFVWAAATWVLHANWKSKEKQYLDQHAAVTATAYRASVNSFALATELIVDETIRRPDVLACRRLRHRRGHGAPRNRGGARIHGLRAKTSITIIAPPQHGQTKVGGTTRVGSGSSTGVVSLAGWTASSFRMRARFSRRPALANSP